MQIVKTRYVKTPTFGSSGAAGIDFYVPDSFVDTTLKPGQDINIPSGIRANIGKGKVLIAFNKSGIATKSKLQVGACVVDEDYTGEIHLHVFNYSNEDIIIKGGQKLVQFVLLDYHRPEILVVQDFDKITERGDKGFGSTGLL